jgi:hypothetical protein
MAMVPRGDSYTMARRTDKRTQDATAMAMAGADSETQSKEYFNGSRKPYRLKASCSPPAQDRDATTMAHLRPHRRTGFRRFIDRPVFFS